jgi:hypothetical protein
MRTVGLMTGGYVKVLHRPICGLPCPRVMLSLSHPIFEYAARLRPDLSFLCPIKPTLHHQLLLTTKGFPTIANMGFLDRSGSSHSINGGNAILRFLQLAVAAIVLGIVSLA